MANISERFAEILKLLYRKSEKLSEKMLEHLSENISVVSDLTPKIALLATSTHSHIAIMGAAALDNALELAILTKMRHLSRDMKDRIFEGYGPLNTFAAKIDIAYALEIIPQEFHESLKKVNKIRNKFAHSQFFLKFQDPEISEIIDSLPNLDLTIEDRKARYLKKLRNSRHNWER